MGTDSKTNTYVVPLSLIGYFEEQAAFNYFNHAGALTKFSAWRNKTSLLTRMQQFCVGNLTPEDFKLKCSELFPALSLMESDEFFSIWREMCVLANNVGARIANIHSLIEAGHTVLIVGNVDSIQIDAIRTMLEGYKFSIPDQGLSCYAGVSGDALLHALLKGQTDRKIYFFSPPPPPLPYEHLGLLRWLIAPFETFFCYRKRRENQAYFDFADSEHGLIEIPVEPNGELVHQLPASDWQDYLSHQVPEYSPYYNTVVSPGIHHNSLAVPANPSRPMWSGRMR